MNNKNQESKYEYRVEAKRIIICICMKMGIDIKSSFDKSLIHILFWKSHMNHWINNGKILTGYPIVCLEDYPGILDIELLIEELIEESIIKDISRYEYLEEEEEESVNKAIDWYNNFGSIDMAIQEVCLHSREWKSLVKNREIGKEMYWILDELSDQKIKEMTDRYNDLFYITDI